MFYLNFFKMKENVEIWATQMERLLRLRTDQIAVAKKTEIDHIVEFAIERLPPALRSMPLQDYMRGANMTIADASALLFPPGYSGPSTASRTGKKSFCCQTTPQQKRTTKEHQTQTPVYTAHKRSRAEMENVELASKIRSQLAVEAQHVILPATGEYCEMPPSKKHQIVNILNAIVSTYEDIVGNDDDSAMRA